MRVTVFGVGYVGLVQAVCLADSGHDVHCVDIDAHKIERLRQGQVTIYEPGLEALLVRNLRDKRLTFSTDLGAGIRFAQVLFIAVGTPTAEDGQADLTYVLAAAKNIGEQLTSDAVVVIKSTVPVGTGDQVQQIIEQQLTARQQSLTIAVVSNPEFLKEGSALNDCAKPDRIIIGTDSHYAEQQMRELYAAFNRTRDKILLMDRRSAELSKYAANCMLATKISFMNEIANLAEQLGADVESVRHGIGSDPRIGYQFIYPGCGYGGSCFPKDVQALSHSGAAHHVPTNILNAVHATNCAQKQKLLHHLQRHFSTLSGKTIAVWGLAFKPNTDDIRDAPSIDLIQGLCAQQARVQVYDPKAMDNTQRYFGQQQGIQYCDDKYATLNGADALVICTEWKEFWAPDFERMLVALKHPVLVDGRNLYEPQRMQHRGFYYYAIGRGASVQRPKRAVKN
ncbi:UDP-glucose 6-dehydrogenase [Vibrio stylophorae]|uniref:UDP-glucose 6-dehydrogenase n=1 Tax=Vibrio stylophorae TaxID=659351 RepID=A0ABM8ZWG5_9VIBR|nr:UDP-glucose/GDP-mannose dehydrogenase family protein [Vibrio stylophorae]CAH0534686.1 UDP-glucose 6-dehydrogenase [Vibrio stylophorae]